MNIIGTLKIGSKGENVKKLQIKLGIIPTDGIFGIKTEQKVKEFQKSKGIKADGVVGVTTWAHLFLSAPQSSQTFTGVSSGMINFICTYETGKKFGYKMISKDLNGVDYHDAQGHKTYGYGLLIHPSTQKYMDTIKKTWTQNELEKLFLEHIEIISQKIDNWAKDNKVILNQNQKDAMTSACYNFGPGFLNKQICKNIAANPNSVAIKITWEHLSDVQGKKFPGLIKRRQAEAKWYFEGK